MRIIYIGYYVPCLTTYFFNGHKISRQYPDRESACLVFYCPSSSGSVIWDQGSAGSEPKEIHWLEYYFVISLFECLTSLLLHAFQPFSLLFRQFVIFFFAPPSTFSVSNASFYFSFPPYLWYFLIAGVDGQIITEKVTFDKVNKTILQTKMQCTELLNIYKIFVLFFQL